MYSWLSEKRSAGGIRFSQHFATNLLLLVSLLVFATFLAFSMDLTDRSYTLIKVQKYIVAFQSRKLKAARTLSIFVFNTWDKSPFKFLDNV